MSDPISSSRAQTPPLDPALHYSEQAEMCRLPQTAPRSASPPAPSPPESSGHKDPIQSLVADAVKRELVDQTNCSFPLGKAAGSCALAMLGGAKGPGPVAVITAAITGALCGIQVMEAYECAARKP